MISNFNSILKHQDQKQGEEIPTLKTWIKFAVLIDKKRPNKKSRTIF